MLTLPIIKPDNIPDNLKVNINNISIKELTKLCDAWSINKKKLTKTKDLQDAIQNHFVKTDKTEKEVNNIFKQNIKI